MKQGGERGINLLRKQRWVFALILLISGGMFACWSPSAGASSLEKAYDAAVGGIVDLRLDDSPKGKQSVKLAGAWLFYWQRLLTPAEWQRETSPVSYLNVPLSWKAEPASTGVDSPYGYGTYRLELHIAPNQIGQSKALFIRSIGSAYRIWIDGDEKLGLGTVGTNRSGEVPESRINLLFFQPQQDTVEIVIQTSNFSFREGGIIGDIVYGDTAALIPSIVRSLLYDLFLVGGFLLIGLYHIVIYRLRRKDMAALIVGVVYVAFAARTLFINGYVSSLVLGIDSWELLVKLEYGTEIIIFLFLALLMHRMYPSETHRLALPVTGVFAALLAVYVMAVPARVFTQTMIIQSAAEALIMLYFIFYVGAKAVVRKREGAALHLIGMGVLIVALINDTLYWARVTGTKEWLGEAAIVFLLLQALIISYRYSLLSQRNDTLVTELGQMNATLEDQVAARTRKLNETNEELSEMKALRTKMLVNIAHDLGTPLIGVQTYLQLMAEGKLAPGNPDITKLLIDKTAYIRQLIDDLFKLSKLESRAQPLLLEPVDAAEWMAELTERFTADLGASGMRLVNDIVRTSVAGMPVRLRIDRYRLMQALHNMIDNAVKFSKDRSDTIVLRGYAEPSAELGGTAFVIELEDRGVGIAAGELPLVFRRFYTKRGGNEQGSGLGLAIVREIALQHGGAVDVASELGRGSTFRILLPVADERGTA
ncbi:ATP-binding protein [Paenibacillus eucommiae]|uniref:histidine kinase n=1 Tax=Paenibacillus eucommiae TaxID=1355755 RepID=A0ABS4J376_9BACL|nr:ATP-binding protein [Paenibacillus eucommiae]MBP1994299.1 signal transduction histidine kinase [Paenibacillus eucommiae]